MSGFIKVASAWWWRCCCIHGVLIMMSMIIIPTTIHSHEFNEGTVDLFGGSSYYPQVADTPHGIDIFNGILDGNDGIDCFRYVLPSDVKLLLVNVRVTSSDNTIQDPFYLNFYFQNGTSRLANPSFKSNTGVTSLQVNPTDGIDSLCITNPKQRAGVVFNYWLAFSEQNYPARWPFQPLLEPAGDVRVDLSLYPRQVQSQSYLVPRGTSALIGWMTPLTGDQVDCYNFPVPQDSPVLIVSRQSHPQVNLRVFSAAGTQSQTMTAVTVGSCPYGLSYPRMSPSDRCYLYPFSRGSNYVCLEFSGSYQSPQWFGYQLYFSVLSG